MSTPGSLRVDDVHAGGNQSPATRRLMADSRSDPTLNYVAHRFEADWAVAPGSLIQAELDALEYSQADVAARFNVSTHSIQLINGHVPLSRDIAVALERVLRHPRRDVASNNRRRA